MTKISTFTSLDTSGQNAHPGPFGITFGPFGHPQKWSLDGSGQKSHPGPFNLADPENPDPGPEI